MDSSHKLSIGLPISFSTSNQDLSHFLPTSPSYFSSFSYSYSPFCQEYYGQKINLKKNKNTTNCELNILIINLIFQKKIKIVSYVFQPKIT